MNPQNGKGSAPRKGADDKKFKDNYDKIFGGKCELCGMKPCKISCPTRSASKWKELQEREKALDELVKQAQEWGMY